MQLPRVGVDWIAVRPDLKGFLGTLPDRGDPIGTTGYDKGDIFECSQRAGNYLVLVVVTGDGNLFFVAFEKNARALLDRQLSVVEGTGYQLSPEELRACTQIQPLQIGQETVAPQPLQTGTLYITSRPPGAKIFLDDVEEGVTPNSFELPIKRYSVNLKMDGHKEYTGTVDIGAGERTTVE